MSLVCASFLVFKLACCPYERSKSDLNTKNGSYQNYKIQSGNLLLYEYGAVVLKGKSSYAFYLVIVFVVVFVFIYYFFFFFFIELCNIYK